jgi:MFS transporter, OPA family, glycerol-3-phosphate transporter
MAERSLAFESEGQALAHKARRRRLARWQGLTVGLMFVGYAGYYLCRSNLSVSLPLMVDDFAAHGMNPDEARIHLGTMVSLGVLAYALGKLVLAGVADFFGGKRNFLGGMAGSVLFTFLFAAGGGPATWTGAWLGNRLVQSGGWAGMVKITSRWFPYTSYATVMGILSLSFLFGDALARRFLGLLIRWGLGWRGVFWVSGGVLLAIFLLNLVLLRESRSEIGESEPAVNPMNVFAGGAEEARPRGIGALLGPFLRSPAFWLVCLLSLCATLVRETFNLWTPTYLHAMAGYGEAQAAEWSAAFPFFGGISVLAAGFLGDRFGPSGRSRVMAAGFLLAAAGLVGLALRRQSDPGSMAVWLVSLVALGLIGPYSYLAGAMALDFGGRQGSAVASGLIDGIGYLGGVLAGDSVARVSVAFGWQTAFAVLAGVTLVSSVAALGLMRGKQ